MKKMLFWLCVLLLVPALAMAGGDGVFIGELKAQTPRYLEGSYEAHGRNISFRAPIYVPDVEAFPILQVKRTCISSEAAESVKDWLEKNTLYGQRIRNHSGTFADFSLTYRGIFRLDKKHYFFKVFAPGIVDFNNLPVYSFYHKRSPLSVSL